MTGIIDRLRAMQGMGDIQLKALMDGVGPQAADEIERLAARLEATEEDRARFLVEMGRLCAQCDALRLRIKAAEKERDDLQARIKEMERQEPVAQVGVHKTGGNAGIAWSARPLNEFDSLPPLRDGDRLYLAPGAQPTPSDEYVGWYCAHCERGVDASEVTYHEQHTVCGRVITDDRPPKSAPIIPEGWKPIPEKHPTFDLVDLRLADGSVLCGCVPQSDGDYWWNGPSGEVFIDPKYAPVTHWRLSATPEAKT